MTVGFGFTASGPPIGNGNTATFGGTDTGTQGSWVGVYGTDGYAIEGDNTSYPAYASVTFTGDSTYTWNGGTSDVRALQMASNHGNRIAACWYTGGSYTVGVNITDGYVHKVRLYALDWDSYGPRNETITVENASNNAVLDTQTVSSFSGGKYLAWNVSGNVNFIVTNIAGGGSNAAISGLFFDPDVNIPGTASAVYALISFGPNGHGAWPRNGGAIGSRLSAGSDNADELTNCDCNSSGVSNSTIPVGTFVQKPATLDPNDPLDAFDDIVVYATRSQLASPTE